MRPQGLKSDAVRYINLIVWAKSYVNDTDLITSHIGVYGLRFVYFSLEVYR